MISARCLLCLFMFVSSVGFAQAPEEVPPASNEVPPPPSLPPPLVPAPDESEVPQEPRNGPPKGESIPWEYKPESRTTGTAGRVLLETLAGGGGALLGGFLGGSMGVLILLASGCDDLECILPLYGITTLSALIGTSTAVWGVGRGLRAQGTFLPTLLGTVLGAVVGILGAVGVATLNNDVLTGITLFAGPVAGAVIGFELSHSFNQPEPPPSEYASGRSGFQIRPVVGVTREGGILGGLAMRF
jgi:hypothetical protein